MKRTFILALALLVALVGPAKAERDYSRWTTDSALSLFETVGVVGDSYASGAIFNGRGEGSENPSVSWPQIAARRNGIQAVNYSRSGMTTRAFLDWEGGLPRLLSDPPRHLYILCLGINDSAVLGPDYLGAPGDMDGGADSFYGNYARIIRAIQAFSPRSRLVISTIGPGTGGPNADLFNEAISAIAEKTGIPCLIQAEDPYLGSAEYAQSMCEFHPTARGYLHMAAAFDRMLSRAIDESPSYFEEYTGSLVPLPEVLEVRVEGGAIAVITDRYAAFLHMDAPDGAFLQTWSAADCAGEMEDGRLLWRAQYAFSQSGVYRFYASADNLTPGPRVEAEVVAP